MRGGHARTHSHTHTHTQTQTQAQTQTDTHAHTRTQTQQGLPSADGRDHLGLRYINKMGLSHLVDHAHRVVDEQARQQDGQPASGGRRAALGPRCARRAGSGAGEARGGAREDLDVVAFVLINSPRGQARVSAEGGARQAAGANEVIRAINHNPR